MSSTPYAPQGFSKEIFQSRYAIEPTETWEEACNRVAQNVSYAETDELKKRRWKDKFADELLSNRFMPGGRIWHAAGRPKGNYMNCYVIPIQEDSREGWTKAMSDMTIITGMGGGVGINFSPIRPKGSPIRGTGGQSAGACGLMHIINAVGDVVRASGGRRPALMMCLDLDHPDIPEFLNKKLDLSQLNNANISVFIPHNKQDMFIDAVKNGADWPLEWNNKVYNTINAKELWDKLIFNALKSAEPGILNGHLMNEMSNISYFKPIIATNPCAEIALEAYGACDLGNLVLSRFVTDSGKMDFNLLGESIYTGVRFLDNVIDVTTYPVHESQVEMNKVRRIGLGVMGLHHMLLLMGMKYDSDEAFSFINELFKFIRNRAYEASCFLAAEKGAFPEYVADKFMESGFVKTLSNGIKEKIRLHGIRNCALLSIPPTGTTSIVCDTSSGLEPIYAFSYERRYRAGEDLKMEVIYDSMFKKFMDEGRDMSLLQSAYDIPVRAHLEIQKICQKYVDNALTKTINIPSSHNPVEISNLMLEYLPHIKGTTVYVDGSRGESPLSNAASLDDAMKNYCPSGVCQLA